MRSFFGAHMLNYFKGFGKNFYIWLKRKSLTKKIFRSKTSLFVRSFFNGCESRRSIINERFNLLKFFPRLLMSLIKQNYFTSRSLRTLLKTLFAFIWYIKPIVTIFFFSGFDEMNPRFMQFFVFFFFYLTDQSRFFYFFFNYD